MGKAVKITVIGAGSVQFSMGLVRDLCLNQNLAGSHVTLMDINAQHLEFIENIAKRYVQELDTSLTFDSTTDRKRALQDADFIINTAGKERMNTEARRACHERHYKPGTGPCFPVGYMYNLPLMLSVAQDVERICPQAWLIQSGNPVYEGVNLITRETGAKIIGLCHGHVHGVESIAKVLGIDFEKINWIAPGLNHTIFLNEFRYEGQDAYPLLEDWINNKAEAYWQDRVERPEKYGLEDHMSRAVVDQYRRFGLWPVGDTTRGGGWWYKSDIETRCFWYGPTGGFGSSLHAGPWQALNRRRYQLIEEVAADPKRSVLEAFPPIKTREQQVPIIDALANDVPGTFQINVPNQGAIPGMPDEVVSEFPALIDMGGIHRLRVNPLPKKLMIEVMWPLIQQMEWEVEAFRSGDRDMLVSALMMVHTYQGGGQVSLPDQARAYVDDYLDNVEPELGAYFPKKPAPKWARLVERPKK